MAFLTFWGTATLALQLLASAPSVWAASAPPGYVTYTNSQNQLIYLADNRKPALYTQNFGDCLGSGKSLINLTRFDAALYRDNMTVNFHISGNTQLKSESIMLYFGVYAYGQTRLELPFNPCGTNILSMCPVKSTLQIEASGEIPLGAQDVQDIPNIAYSIPDFEGQAIVRIFANSTQSEIACYTASVTNGASFNQQKSVGSILGIFTFVAMVASFATAIYGESIPGMRIHHAHSLSVLVVFAVYQHIFFTGALSMNWPSVSVAWMSNFAWAGGMIYVSSMQDSLSKLMGNHQGNTLVLGAAQAGSDASSVGGGYDIHKIFRRKVAPLAKRMYEHSMRRRENVNAFARRDLINSTTGYRWYGSLVKSGLPLPGNYSGFAGTLSEEGIPASNAFLTGLIWFLILLLIVTVSVASTKLVLGFLVKRKTVKSERFNYFLAHWKGYTAAVLLKSCYIAFFSMMFLTVFQFTYDGAPAAIAIAAIVFVIFFVGILGISGYACYYRLRHGTWTRSRDSLLIERTTTAKIFPWFHVYRSSAMDQNEKKYFGSVPWKRISRSPDENEVPVHSDEDYIKKFGWLASRFRQSKWWFFSLWTVYELVRACFYGGASGHAQVQVFGLLIVEIIAFVVIFKLRPYEGQRLNVVMVYLLGFSKVLTVALSAAFDIDFNTPRIQATVIGVVIIVIQGILVIALLICIVLSAISSYFSVTRNRESIKPKRWMPYRVKYFAHIDQAATDMPKPVPEKRPETPEELKGPYFSVNSVRRVAKIEDEDAEFQKEITADPRADSRASLPFIGNGTTSTAAAAAIYPVSGGIGVGRSNSRAHSICSTTSQSSLPYAARLHRGSWSTKDFQDWQAERDLGVDRQASQRRSRPVYVPAFDESEIIRSPGLDAPETNPLDSPDAIRDTASREAISPHSPGTPDPTIRSSSAPVSPTASRPATSSGDLLPAIQLQYPISMPANPPRPDVPLSETPVRNVSPRTVTTPPASPTRPRFAAQRGSVRKGDSIDEGRIWNGATDRLAD
jgi:hypothetical protein